MSYNKSFEKMIRQMKYDNPWDFENLDWTTISSYKYLSEDFIEEFLDKLNINSICSHQHLSEDFLRKHSHRIDYKAVSTSQIQNLSYDFIFENKDKMLMPIVKKNKKYIKSLQNTNTYSHINVISYKYKDNYKLIKAIYNYYRFSDDTNTVLLDRSLNTIKTIPKYTQIQDTNFFDTIKYKHPIASY